MSRQRWTHSSRIARAATCLIGLGGWQIAVASVGPPTVAPRQAVDPCQPYQSVGAADVAATIAVSPESLAGHAAADQITEAGYRYLLGDDQGNAGILYTHNGNNRGYGPEHDLARANIVNEFESFGLTVALEPFNYSGKTYYNIIATMVGTVFPDEEYIIGAHYDSVNNPGADDNASGTALVLQVASVLSQYPSDYTIRFIGFDREEQGLIGSKAYVNAHLGANIRGMISTDMVGYNKGTNSADIFGGSGSVALRGAIAAAVAEYGQGLGSSQGGAHSGSDHRPFEQAGYQACLFIEDWGNPNYHSSRDSVDTPNYIDYAYAARMARSITGFLVDSAGVQVSMCYADCETSTGMGVLDIFDFLCFQDAFVAGDPYACDCDTSTGPGVCDIFDFLCFQSAFVGGCP